MKIFNRLANRETLILVAIAASAITLQVRQHTIDPPAARAEDGRVCEPPAAQAAKARVLPADCNIRANLPLHRSRATWV
ncbi:hypothetical protein AWB80_07255 [Caballeronia pedi]|uniref:Uncharacterized protein n=1 Tax=Caballeronia pedi TaxID=1777141 RepID=A0A158DQ96_9BURK|nr:hypothetical protein AWB80_07255 [Caballeronia pedi]